MKNAALLAEDGVREGRGVSGLSLGHAFQHLLQLTGLEHLARGQVRAKALVTKRIQALSVAGREVHTVGLPIHWGFEGLTKTGHLVNTLTPFVGDANVQTPEFKAFLVNVEKAPAGVA